MIELCKDRKGTPEISNFILIQTSMQWEYPLKDWSEMFREL